ncbi:MAG: hypothetical protein IJ794_18485 [Lachnospiraceae bacterium]|nr:hypothetical protein [Lachnospiraceae bacterium]
MKKKGKLLFLTALTSVCVVSLTGCGGTLPEMTDDQANAIGEYAAVTLLKYDANSKSRLVDLAMLEKVEEIEQQPVQPVPETQGSDSVEPEQQPAVIDNTANVGEVMAASMEEFLELPDGMTLSYTGYEMTQSYREEGDLYFALEASAGKELMVISFSLENQSGEDKELRLIDLRNSYRVTVNDEYTRTALTTMLGNDLSTFIGTLKAGESRTLVLLIEVDPDKVPQVDTITLKFKNTETSFVQQVV